MTDKRGLLDTYLAPPGSGADPLDHALQTDERDRAARALWASRGANQQRAAAANRLARSTGLPGDVVERNYDAVDADHSARQTAPLLNGNPFLASWYSDPRNAAASKGDAPRLDATSKMLQSVDWSNLTMDPVEHARVAAQREWKYAGEWVTDPRNPEYFNNLAERDRAHEIGMAKSIEASRPDSSLWSWWRGVGVGTVGGFKQAGIGAKLYLADMLGLPTIKDEAIGEYRQVNEDMARADPKGLTGMSRSVYSGLISTGQALPALGATLLTLPEGGVGGLWVAGGQTGLQAYGKYRERGGTPNEALLGGGLEGGIEAATEMLPLHTLAGGFGKKGFGRFMAEYGLRELGGEELATAGQDAVDTAIANPNKTWSQYGSERWQAAIDTAVAVAIQSGVVGGLHHAVRSLAPVSEDMSRAANGFAGSALLDGVMTHAEGSALREADPHAFEQFIAMHTEGSPVEHVYVPAEKLRELMQSDGYDPKQWEFAPDLNEQVTQASTMGGDVVLPLAGVAAHLAGTPAWEQIRGDVRLQPGGMSENDATEFAGAYEEVMAEQGKKAAEALRAEEEALAPARKVYNAVLGQVRQAGFNLRSAQAYAEVWAQRYAARAERLGIDPWEAFQRSNVSIHQELPAALEGYRKADSVDLLINAMRGGAERTKPEAPSLLEWISKRGGVEDRSRIDGQSLGGDIAAMGGEKWHRAKPFRKKLIKETMRGQGDMIGGNEASPHSQNVTLDDAVAAGYFPELVGKTNHDSNVLLAAIERELSGTPVYPVTDTERSRETQDQLAQAADELRTILENQGLDPATATRTEVDAAISAYEGEHSGASREFDQAAQTNTPEFKAWFGDSKVVDANGKPLVMYHGTRANVGAFDKERVGERFADFSIGFHFTSSTSEASLYADGHANLAAKFDPNSANAKDVEAGANVIPVYLKIENPLIIDSGKQMAASRADNDRGDIIRQIVESRRAAGEDAAKHEAELIDSLLADFGVDAPPTKPNVKLPYDGIIIRSSRNDEWDSTNAIVFEPSQIKSAVGNTGAFNPQDSRILHQDDNRLVALHNIKPRGVLNASRQGGLAVPSIAITRADLPFDNFGEITLVGPPSMVDPQTDRSVKAFGADAYSPRYPTVEYQIDDAKAAPVFKALADGAKVLGDRIDYQALEKDGPDAVGASNVVMAQFLLDNGIEPNIERYGERQTIDRWGTQKNMRAQLEPLAAKYDAYVRGITDTIFKGERIFNGFTHSGNRRYLRHDLDTVVKLLKKGLRDGEGFNYGVGSIRATIAPKFSTLKAMKKAAGKLVTEAEMDTLKNEASDELIALAERLQPYYKYDKNAFGYLDQVSEALKDVARTKRLSALDTDFEGLPLEEKRAAWAYLEKLRDMPTEYFEAKIQRGVRLNEFVGAIVPEDVEPNVRQVLEGAGLQVETYAKSEGRQAALAKFADRAFFQPGARGRIDIYDDGRNIIRLFDGRDLSTLLHESSHLWLEELRADAESTDAPDQLRADWDTVKAWFEQNGHALGADGFIPTDAHEMWARAGERYFMEGKAPSSALRTAFKRFSAWLLRLYQVVARLNTPLTDEVRGVMDRLIATDSEIERASRDGQTQALFNTAADAGMTDAEFAAYQATVGQARTDAFDALLYRTMETIRRARTVEWQEERKTLREKVAAELANLSEFKALAILRAKDDTKLSLSLSAIREDFGEEGVAMLPRGSTLAEGGVHPDILAERVGAPTGRELVERLMGIEQRQAVLRQMADERTARRKAGEEVGEAPPKTTFDELVDQRTDAMMRERHGDVLSDGSIEEEALAAIHNDTRATVLASELAALGRKVGTAPTPWKLAREWAKRIVREGLVSEQATGAAIALHERNEAKAGRAAEKAILAGDLHDAFKQKQKQLLANAMFRAAKDAKDEIDGIVKRLGRLANAKALPSMDQEYLDRIHDLLENYDMRPRTARELVERESFAKWVEAKEAAGEEVHVPQRLRDAGKTNFSKLTVDDLTALDDAVTSIAFLGRKKKKLTLANEEREFAEVVEDFVNVAEALPERKFSADRNRKRSWARAFDALMVKMEFLADDLDNGNPNGIANRLLVQGSTKAANLKAKLSDLVLKPIARAYLDMPKAMQKRMAERVTVPEFSEINPLTREIVPSVFTRMDLLAVALNVGNDSNFDKMVRGESLAFKQMPDYQWTREKVEAVLARELTQEDWQFVESIGRQLEVLRPHIQQAEKDITGVEPEWIEPRDVKTPFGTLKGWYYPVVYDPARSQRASDNYADDAAKLLGQMGRAVSTPKGHTIERTEYAAPLMLALEPVLLNHIQRVTTRIAYGAWVRDVLKFTNNGRVRSMIDRKLGPEYHAQIVNWLRGQVNEAAMDTNQLRFFDSILRKFRTNATMVGLGFRFTTMLAQIGGLAVSANEVGGGWLLRGMGEATANMGNVRGFVFARSEEMARRAQDFDRDVSTAFRDMAGRKSKLDGIRAMAFWGIGQVDVNLVAIPTWLAAYRKALSGGMTEEDAAMAGDKAVRRSQGSGRAKDMAAIQNANEGYRVMTMFYSFFSVLYNQQREMVRDTQKGDYRKAAMTAWWVLVAAPLMSALLSGDWPQADEEESWLHWASRKMFFGLWGGVPIVRDVAGMVDRKVSGQYAMPTTAPSYRALAGVVQVGSDAVQAAKGDDPSERWLRNAIETPGYFVGLPTGQVATSIDYGYAVSKGDQHPEGPVDVATGILKGRREAQE